MTFRICEKRQRVLDAAGHVLVIGGPGSGKTSIAIKKAVQRICHGLSPGQEVVFLSFSRAAVARVVEASKTQVPKEQQGQLGIQTFHSFFWEILRTHGYLLGAPRRLVLLLPHDEKVLSDGIGREDAGWSMWETERLRLFHEEGKVAFDLFAPMAADLLARSSLIRNLVSAQFPLIIVDEAQDTGPDAWRCIEILSGQSQIVCLADLEQQIFDFLPGVGPERVTQIRDRLNPLTEDLGGENHRSPNNEIVAFGNDILTCHVRGTPYKGVSSLGYSPKAEKRDGRIRASVGMLLRMIQEETGNPPESIALLASYDKGVTLISSALRSEPEIHHRVLFNEAPVALASRLTAFLLEPKGMGAENEDIAIALELLAAANRARGTKGTLILAKKLLLSADEVRLGSSKKRTNLLRALRAIILLLQSHRFSGDPGKDWLFVRYKLRDSGEETLRRVSHDLEYLMAFNRGRRISGNLSAIWSETGTYARARQALDSALAEEQILSGIDDLRGIHVMTMHKSKGKQFDGVVILRETHRSPFIWPNDKSPFPKSRKVLRVAITRAKHHVLILNPVFPNCPIISPHAL